MIEDMQHLAVIDAHMREVQDLISHYNARASGITDKHELVKIRMAGIDAVTELLRQQKRALCFMVGLPYEPEAHQAEAVLIGVGMVGAG